MATTSTTTSLPQHSLTTGVESDAIQLWVDALTSRKWAERHDARLRLARLGDPAVEAVTALMDDPHELTRWEAVKTLADMTSPVAAPALVRALTDEDSFGVRWVAAEGLVKLGRDALVPLFEALMRNPRSVYLRVGAHHVLVAVRRRGDAVLVEPVLEALGSYAPRVDLPLVARDALANLEDLVRLEEEIGGSAA